MGQRKARPRRWALRIRAAYESAREASQRICSRVISEGVFERASQVVLYVAVDGEVRTEALQQAAVAVGKRVFFPSFVRGGEVEFYEDRTGVFEAGRWRIPEPVSTTRLLSCDDTLFVIPGVLFDLQGYRVGRGQGVYDRALASRAAGVRVAVAYEYQVVPLLPRTSRDVRMDMVFTDRRSLKLRERCSRG